MNKRWPEIAAEGKKLLEGLPAGGSILVKRSQAADRLGITRETLHNYMAAAEFLESIRSVAPQAAGAMLSLSATSVGVYARWWRRDPAGVADHAMEAAREGWSAAKITEDERTARLSSAPMGLLDQALASARDRYQHAQVADGIAWISKLAGLEALPLGSLSRAKNVHPLSRTMGAYEVLRSPPADELLGWFGYQEKWPTNSNGSLDAIAVVEVERGVIGDAHRRNARNTIAKAALAATVHPVVLLLLEDLHAVADFVEALPALKDYRLPRSETQVDAFMLVPGKGVVVAAPAQGFGAFWSGVYGSA